MDTFSHDCASTESAVAGDWARSLGARVSLSALALSALASRAARTRSRRSVCAVSKWRDNELHEKVTRPQTQTADGIPA